ncbi:MAG: hypothetical protein KIS77_19595 [Saprospiraceae bacterium]|nr:hypothetical protein [Saprospiraceae bacterium]
MEHRLREEAARKGVSIDHLILQGLEHQIGESAPPESLSELELLKKINLDLGIAPKVWERYDYLNERLHEELLTEPEHQELIALIDVVETANVERLKYLIQLAKLRNVPVQQIMSELGIRPRDHKYEDE